MSLLGQLDIFHGEASPALAYVYARLTLSEPTVGLTLTGEVRGPECSLSHTLPATMPLVPEAPGETLLARTVIPDPCFWSPRLPAMYRVRVELRRDHVVLESTERMLGIRVLGVRDNRLLLEGKGWVLRAVLKNSVVAEPIKFWRDASAAMVVENPTDQVCAEASRLGVLLMATLPDPQATTAPNLRRLASWPAVGFVLAHSSAKFPENYRQLMPTTLLVYHATADQPGTPPPWADILACPVASIPQFKGQIADCRLPIFAVRSASKGLRVQEARAECDLLQRDLAALDDFAGYVV